MINILRWREIISQQQFVSLETHTRAQDDEKKLFAEISSKSVLKCLNQHCNAFVNMSLSLRVITSRHETWRLQAKLKSQRTNGSNHFRPICLNAYVIFANHMTCDDTTNEKLQHLTWATLIEQKKIGFTSTWTTNYTKRSVLLRSLKPFTQTCNSSEFS